MWKKSDPVAPDPESVTTPEREHSFELRREPPPAPDVRKPATIGPSIAIRGDVTGEEDLVVQGRVEGTLKLPQNNVTVGKEGQVKANMHAKVIEVQGRVEGDMHGDEQVVIRRSGNVQGNILAPRVTLEDGCKFRGSIDMEMRAAEKRPVEARAFPGVKPAPVAAKEPERGGGVPPPKDQKASG